MWVARDKDGRRRFCECKPHRKDDCWHCEGNELNVPWDELIIDGQLENLLWEDEPIECRVSVFSRKRLLVCPKCGRRIWFAQDEIHYEHSEDPWSGYTEEWEWIECPECREKTKIR